MHTNSTHATRAFTLLELLTILSLLAILTALAVPGFGRIKPASQHVRCLNNLKQLTSAWSMYAADNGGLLVSNNFGAQTANGVYAGWVSGWLDWSSATDNTNTALLTNPRYAQLGPYIRGVASVFKCPADRYQSSVNRGPRVRSISMNAALGPAAGNRQLFSPPFFIITRSSEFVRPAPAAIFVFADEHPDSINDPAIINNPNASPAAYTWTDLPASYHNGACGFSFADSHAELKKWTDKRTVLPVTMGLFTGNLACPNSPDYAWVAARITQR